MRAPVRQVRCTPKQREKIRALIAAGHSSRQIAEILGRTKSGIIGIADRWKLGPWQTKPGYGPGSASRLPLDFADQWRIMNHSKLGKHYGRSPRTITHWVKLAGLVRTHNTPRTTPLAKPRLVSGNNTGGHKPAKFTDVRRDTSLAGQAADHLRRLSAVYRCNDQGTPAIGGKFWNRGGHVLTDADIIERAERNGWCADAWKMVA